MMKLLILLVPMFAHAAADAPALESLRRGEKTGFIDAAGRWVIEPAYDRADKFAEGLVSVKKDGKWGFIDESGKIVVGFSLDDTYAPMFDTPYRFNGGLSPARVDGKWGYVDKTGAWVVEPKYTKAGLFAEGLARVSNAPPATARAESGDVGTDMKNAMKDATEGNWGYIDANGKEVIKHQFVEAADFSNGKAAAALGGKWGLINKKGEWVVRPRFDRNPYFKDDIPLAAVKIDGKSALVDRNFREVVPPIYEDAWEMQDGLAAVKTGGKWGFVSIDGKMAIEPRFARGGRFSEGLASMEEGGKSGYIDRKGRWVIRPQYRNARPFSEGLAAVDMKREDGQETAKGNIYEEARARHFVGTWGFIDKTGTMVIAPQFDEIRAFKEGLAEVKYNGKWGFIDSKGKIICPLEFEWANSFKGGRARVGPTKEKSGLIDRQCKYIIEP